MSTCSKEAFLNVTIELSIDDGCSRVGWTSISPSYNSPMCSKEAFLNDTTKMLDNGGEAQNLAIPEKDNKNRIQQWRQNIRLLYLKAKLREIDCPTTKCLSFHRHKESKQEGMIFHTCLGTRPENPHRSREYNEVIGVIFGQECQHLMTAFLLMNVQNNIAPHNIAMLKMALKTSQSQKTLYQSSSAGRDLMQESNENCSFSMYNANE
ncbi:hypothetical protein RB195_003525 [Necator americanus]|uniref:Uncharacterized protein n=1 Tax=Necator americanus TaxID=51031 RepID=A0ABR1DQH8_NECAM